VTSVAVTTTLSSHCTQSATCNPTHTVKSNSQTGAPRKVVEAAAAALSEQRLGYTEALGVAPLRQRISQHYAETYGIEGVAPARIAVTTGSRWACGDAMILTAARPPDEPA
jgi:aspartate/methionine/tyrosine aminotransferase